MVHLWGYMLGSSMKVARLEFLFPSHHPSSDFPTDFLLPFKLTNCQSTDLSLNDITFYRLNQFPISCISDVMPCYLHCHLFQQQKAKCLSCANIKAKRGSHVCKVQVNKITINNKNIIFLYRRQLAYLYLG